MFIFLPLRGSHAWEAVEYCDQRSLIGTCHVSIAYAQTTHQLAGRFLNPMSYNLNDRIWVSLSCGLASLRRLFASPLLLTRNSLGTLMAFAR